jgi:hypothetical protein
MRGTNTETLSVSHCTFKHLRTTSGQGGAVSVFYISSSILVGSVFYNVSSIRQNGGVTCEHIPGCVLVHSCSFITAIAETEWIGGLEIHAFQRNAEECIANHSIYTTVFRCEFCKCTSKSGESGGLCVVTPPSGFGIRDCLFFNCSAATHAGGLKLLEPTNVGQVKCIRCCLFHHNSAVTGPDILIEGTYFTDTPCEYSYSTSENTVYQSGVKSNWLITTTVPTGRIVNGDHDHALDTYGCGIDSTWPCKTNQWTNSNPLFLRGSL